MAKKKKTKTLTTRMNEADAEIQELKDAMKAHNKEVERQETAAIQRRCKHQGLTVRIDADGYLLGDAVCRVCKKELHSPRSGWCRKFSVKRIYRKFVKKSE